MFQAEAVIKKISLPSLQDSNVMYFRILILIFLVCFSWIFENWVLNFSSICFRYHERQTNKQTKIITTYNEFLGTWLESKKGICLVYISKGKLSKLAVSPHPAPQHVKETFPDMHSCLTLPNQFSRTTNVKFNIAYKISNKKL